MAVQKLYSQESLNHLKNVDQDIFNAINNELNRQQNQLEMIASENFASQAVIMACGSVMTNKYAEGYPGRRYYNGCEFVDAAENLAIERAKKLFDCKYANVQPHSGSQANQAVFAGLLSPGDTFMGMSLDAGGHLTHGSKVSISGKWFNSVAYGIDPDTNLIDMAQVRKLAMEHKPKLIIAGGSAYPRNIDLQAFQAIAREVNAYFMVDMAHFAGLVAGKQCMNPVHYADVVTTTTHKTLRGPRGGMILTNDDTLIKKINSAVMPGIQGGPLMHIIAAKAIAFKEALQPEFRTYAKQVITNAQTLANTLSNKGIDIVSKGTDCHLILVDLRSLEINGTECADALERAGITCNKNSVYNDPRPPMETSGLRFGTPALTTRGMVQEQFIEIGQMIATILYAVKDKKVDHVINDIKIKINALCNKFPLNY